MDELAAPFPADAIQWKAQATTADKKRAMAVPYTDIRHYIERLNDVVADGWDHRIHMEQVGNKLVVLSSLTSNRVTRTDVGETKIDDENAATSSVAQAFKRACVQWGLGLYIYRLPKKWVDYDADRKRITPQAIIELNRLASATAGTVAVAGGEEEPQAGVPSNPSAMLKALNVRLKSEYFGKVAEVLEAYRLEGGDKNLQWPKDEDADGWKELGNVVLSHVKKMKGNGDVK